MPLRMALHTTHRAVSQGPSLVKAHHVNSRTTLDNLWEQQQQSLLLQPAATDSSKKQQHQRQPGRCRKCDKIQQSVDHVGCAWLMLWCLDHIGDQDDTLQDQSKEIEIAYILHTILL